MNLPNLTNIRAGLNSVGSGATIGDITAPVGNALNKISPVVDKAKNFVNPNMSGVASKLGTGALLGMAATEVYSPIKDLMTVDQGKVYNQLGLSAPSNAFTGAIKDVAANGAVVANNLGYRLTGGLVGIDPQNFEADQKQVINTPQNIATNNVGNNVSLPVFKSNYQPLNAPVAGNIGSINPYQFQNNGVNALGISQDMINRAGQYNPMVNQDAFNQRQIQANEYANLDNAYRGQHLSNFMNAGSLADFFGAAIIGHQDRAGMARATELLKQNNQLAANNIENINNTNLQNIENQRQTGIGLGNIANSQNQIANNLQESQAKNLIDTAKFNLDANRENFNQANSSYQNQINAQLNYPKLAYLSDIKQMRENPISLNTEQAKLVAMQNGTDYNLVKQQVGGSEDLANKMLSNKLMQNNVMNAVMGLNLGNGQMPGGAPAETTQIIYDENNNKVMEIKGTAQAVLNAQKQFPSFNPLGNNTIPVAQNGATMVQK